MRNQNIRYIFASYKTNVMNLQEHYEALQQLAVKEYQELIKFVVDNNDNVSYIENTEYDGIKYVSNTKVETRHGLTLKHLYGYQIEELNGYKELNEFIDKWCFKLDLHSIEFCVDKKDGLMIY